MRYLFPAFILLAASTLFSCSKSDQGVEASNMVGRWNLSAYMEDVNNNRANDDPKMPLQSYEFYLLNFTNDGKLQVRSQKDASTAYDLNYDWAVSSDNRVILQLIENTPSGKNTYNIEVVAISFNTLVLLHDNYNSGPALRYSPPHPFNTNWLIFSRQQ